MITTYQLRAARALTGIDQRELAALSGLSLPTIQRMEASDSIIRGTVDSLMKELSPIFGDGLHGQAAAFLGSAADFVATSIPSLNFTPKMIFGNRS